MNLSYIATNLEELMDQASPEIQKLVHGNDIDETTAVLGKIYKIPISSYLALSNLILFILLGALKPEDVVRGIIDILHLSEEEALKLAQDLDKSILEKARIKVLGKAPTDMVELTFQEGRTPDELRKEILDTTKREPPVIKEQTSLSQEGTLSPSAESTAAPLPASTVSATDKKKVLVAPGSRSQLLEQLQVLDAIPDDEEISARLSKIQEQIASLEGKEGEATGSAVPLQNYMFGEKGKEEVEAELQSASYSKAPTKYNVDPYREIADES